MSEGFQDQDDREDTGEKPGENQKRSKNENKQLRDATQLAALKQNIVQAINVEAFYLKYLSTDLLAKHPLHFKSDGWSLHVHCPIHGDTGKPNLSINRNSAGFKCFSCGKKGSIFDFWCHMHGRDPDQGFQEALIDLATQCGIDIGADTNYAPLPIDTKVSSGKAFVPKINKAAAADNSIPPINRDVVIKYHAALQAEHYKYLRFERGLKDKTIKKYLVGWDSKMKYKNLDGVWTTGKFTIPVICQEELVRNVRVYAQDTTSDMKMINTKGYGSPSRLFPLNELVKLKPSVILYCEGEFDCMLLNQHLDEAGLLIEGGWLGVTNTAGCNTFETEWMEYFAGKKFYFMLDVDKPGRTWAESHARTFFMTSVSSGNTPELKIVTLPLDGNKGSKDIGDYFVKLGGTWGDLLKVINDTPARIISSTITKVETDESLAQNLDTVHSELTTEPIEVANFEDCVKNREYIDCRVRVPVTISGECNKIYHACRSLRVADCPKRRDDSCCSLGAGVQTIPYGDVAFIECCMASRKNIDASLKSLACTRGAPCTIEEVEKVVMQEYFGHQVIKRLTAEPDESGRMVNSQQLVSTSLYILQPENHIKIEPQDYMATGYIRSHPQTRQVTMFVENLEPLQEDWKKFDVTPEAIEHLKVFEKNEKVSTILNELTTGVTQIYESNDILLTVLLTYLSPLWFTFNGKIIRGWINSCIIGDSGTGKTATYLRISDWLDLGDLFSALSGTRTGLLYSIKQKGTEWYVQIGRYVTASGKVIAIDETQELSAEETSKMAIAMDQGWLEVNQVASAGYHTTTRTVFMMNPKPPKKISDFAYGCMSIAECFNPMFIRRLDMAVFTTAKESIEFYNQRYVPSESKNISVKPDDFRSLIYWAWTRGTDDIEWTDEATSCCLGKATEISTIYGNSDDILLAGPQDFRNKLARLSTAFAILSGSFNETYTGVVVKSEHVETMAKFVDVLYSSQSCNLKQYSRASSKKKTLLDFEKINETFSEIVGNARHSPDRRWSEGQHFLQLLLMLQQQSKIRKRDLSDQLGVSITWIQKHIAILQMYNLIEIHQGGYRTTRKFNLFMQKWQESDEIDQMLESVTEKIGKLAMINNAQEYEGFQAYQNQDDDPFNS